jgi:hypothetical protein
MRPFLVDVPLLAVGGAQKLLLLSTHLKGIRSREKFFFFLNACNIKQVLYVLMVLAILTL